MKSLPSNRDKALSKTFLAAVKYYGKQDQIFSSILSSNRRHSSASFLISFIMNSPLILALTQMSYIGFEKSCHKKAENIFHQT